jgi:hypothetical protein
MQHGMSYNLILDPSLTLEEQEAVVTGSYAWEKAIPGLTFHYQWSACHGFGDSSHTICIYADQDTPLDDNGYMIDARTIFQHGFLTPSDSPASDSCSIDIHSANMANHGMPYPNVALNVVTHELGHAMTHNSQHIAAGNLMSFCIVKQPEPEVITSADMDYFWSAR